MYKKSDHDLEEKFRAEGRLVERRSGDTINVSGINITNGWITTFDWNDEYKMLKSAGVIQGALKILEFIKDEEQHEYYYERKQKTRGCINDDL